MPDVIRSGPGLRSDTGHTGMVNLALETLDTVGGGEKLTWSELVTIRERVRHWTRWGMGLMVNGHWTYWGGISYPDHEI